MTNIMDKIFSNVSTYIIYKLFLEDVVFIDLSLVCVKERCK
jgi:hypothetical protein